MVRLGMLTSLLLMTCVASAGYQPYIRKVARVTFAGTTPTINNELKGHWVQSVSRAMIGQITLTIEPNVFPATPVCFCNAEMTAGGCNALPASATSIAVKLTDLNPVLLSVTGIDTTFNISCEYTETP